MHTILDTIAQRSPLREISPEFKTIFVLATLLIIIASPSPLVPFTALLSLSWITVTMGKLSLRVYLKLLSAPLFFTLPAAVVFPLLQGSRGMEQALLIIARVLGSTSVLYFLILTTPMPELFHSLSRFLPELVTELSMLIYRYIFVVLEEAERMHIAIQSKGITGFRARVRAFSLLATNLFVRAINRGERLSMAMESRGYSGRLRALSVERRLSPGAVLMALAFEIFLLSLSWRSWA